MNIEGLGDRIVEDLYNYGYIKDNLPKHLISFTHEIAGKQYKIPILIGHETIYNDEPIKKEHCDEKYNIFSGE